MGVAVVEQEHEDAELFVRARRQSTLGGQQPHVTVDFAPFEEIEKRGDGHLADRYSLKFIRSSRAVTPFPGGPRGLAAAPLSVIVSAEASSTVNMSSRCTAIVCRSPACITDRKSTRLNSSHS